MTTDHDPAGRASPSRTEKDRASAILTSLTTGTMIATRTGDLPVEWLETGDEVLTADAGFQAVTWINRVRFDRIDFRRVPEFAPICLRPGVLGPGSPAREVRVSPHQLVVYRSPRAELDYWSAEVLVPACALGDRMDTETLRWHERVGYTQILLSGHHLIQGEGVLLASLFLADLHLLPSTAGPPELETLQKTPMQAARPILSVDEARALIIADTDAQTAAEPSARHRQTRARDAG